MSALATRELTVTFGRGAGRLVAVDRASIEIARGMVLGLVGESGSGKSTIARAIVGLVDCDGEVLIADQDVRRLPRAQRRAARQRVQMVFQDPYASLNPRMTVGETLAEALGAGRMVRGKKRDLGIARLFELVSLDARRRDALPRELSGGQRQRVAIARALAVEPSVLIADEITSALDVSVQGAILNVLRDLRRELELSILFISHDLSVVRYVSDAIAVMYLGRIVETAPADELLTGPEHPYTRALLAAIPTLGRRTTTDGSTLDEDPPDPHSPPRGCHFHPRCPEGPLTRPDREVCASHDPWLEAGGRRHGAACHFAGNPTSAPADPSR